MTSKKVINGVEYEKIDTVSININGENSSDNSFTGEYISNLSKSGPIIIDIDTINTIPDNLSIFSDNEPIQDNLSEMSQDLPRDKKSNKSIFIAIGIVSIILIGLLLIL